MISEGYALTLKKLITFTQAKFISLADVVGYDVSYVNKWSNGTKLPSSRYVERINDEMGQYFAELITLQKKEDRFLKTFPLSSEFDDLGFAISQYLCAAYRFTLSHNRSAKGKDSRADIQVITGHHDTADFLADLLQKGVQNLTSDGELLILGEFCTLADTGFWNYLEPITLTGHKLTIRVGLNLDTLEQHPAYVSLLYKILDHYLDFDFVFYDSQDVANANLIILKGVFVVQYALSVPARFYMCTYICDESQVWDIYEKFSLTNTGKKEIISSVSALGMDEMDYRTAFYATTHFFFYLTNGFEFLLPHEVFDNIIKQGSAEQAFAIQRLCVTWEEVLNASEIHFIMPTTSLIRYAETGYIYLTDVEYTLSAEERKSHIRSIMNGMKQNPLLKTGVLLPSLGEDIYMGQNLAFYSNYSTGFLKKNKKYVHNDANSFYVLISARLHSIILNFFQGLQQSPLYQEYTQEQLEQKYELYKPLIERTLQLKKNTH
ncbi:MAG: hypothetical protein LKF74_07360 [Megasphaera sp.]|jgi:hypothetical protein|nr:hypothetical protein [Megasphaera sp.]MCH4188529.1 hypothetical protein [Megasphaera sp.]MCH4218360.1 hypothetical protein [Megasphaera sp.]